MGFQPEQCAKLCCLFIEDFEPPKCSVSGPGNPCDVCLQVSEMDVQIARARSLLADLGSKRKQLKMKLNSRHDQIARYLPVEVASHIFTFYVHGTDSTQPSYKTASSAKRGVPLVLAAVCKAWRRIVFATPQLWTTMNIDLSIAGDPALQVELATQWLRRSGNMPLSITVDAPPNDGSQRPDRHTGALFEILKTYAFRWKQLALFIPNKFYSAFTEGLDDVPLLESLSLMRTWDDTELDDELADVFALNVAPCFKDLTISSIELNLLQMQIDTLTSLWFNNVTVDEIFEILSHATQLIKCEFYWIQGNTNSFPFPDAPVVHSSLKSLSISPEDKNGATPEELSHLFDLLELPSLKYFSHISTNSKHPMAVMSLSSLFTRSHSPLEHLSITVTDTGVASSESEIISLLENLPTITHFAISSPTIYRL
ncbi:hypothetical protein BDZ97DRAFT_1364012 [Flammula alnicola]|nr:hypothetical protein BDZ97DRAFT_1364012 [Flammula alnicola]